MKVNNTQSSPQKAKQSSKKLTKSDIQARIQARFGKQAELKQPRVVQDTVELNSKGSSASADADNNDPDSTVTRDKLRGILKAGGFDFNAKERKALSEILN